MPLKLMYITNKPEVAEIAEATGVDRIFIDMEYIGKEDRQAGLDCVKSHHTIEDVEKIRKVITKSEVLVRVNPIHDATAEYSSSVEEINAVIEAGADIIMLPMYKTISEVYRFLNCVKGRTKTLLLAETPEACTIMQEVASLPEVDEIHIGLNDLHLALKRKFMFELLADGTVESICADIKDKPYGFGGIARIGYGILPAEFIIREHYRLGSTRAILSRSFCNADRIQNTDEIRKLFETEVIRIRQNEKLANRMSDVEFEENRRVVINKVAEIVAGM